MTADSAWYDVCLYKMLRVAFAFVWVLENLERHTVSENESSLGSTQNRNPGFLKPSLDYAFNHRV